MRRTGGRFLPLPLRIRNLLRSIWFRLIYGRSFAAFGRNSKILSPDSLEGIGNIWIEPDVFIGYHGLLAARPIEDGQPVALRIGQGSRLGRNNHLYATRAITLGRQVLTASNVYIADNTHRFDDPDLAVIDQPLKQLPDVEIGDGTWIGHGACVIGARIGRNCVIGAGAMVTRDVPDHCVVVDSPARIVKRYDPEQGKWRKTQNDGTFADDAV